MGDRAQAILQVLEIATPSTAWEASVASVVRDLVGTIEGLEARLAAEEAASKSLGLAESYAEIAAFIAQRTRRHCPSCASSTDAGNVCDAGENQTVDAPCAKWEGR